MCVCVRASYNSCLILSEPRYYLHEMYRVFKNKLNSCILINIGKHCRKYTWLCVHELVCVFILRWVFCPMVVILFLGVLVLRSHFVCLCLSGYEYICLCLYICFSMCASLHVCVMSASAWVCLLSIWVYVCLSSCVSSRVSVYVYLFVYLPVFLCVCICLCVYNFDCLFLIVIACFCVCLYVWPYVSLYIFMWLHRLSVWLNPSM